MKIFPLDKFKPIDSLIFIQKKIQKCIDTYLSNQNN